MVRSVLFAGFSIAMATAATAGAMPVARVTSAHPSHRQDLVSANLNKIVFWHVPGRGERETSRRDADD